MSGERMNQIYVQVCLGMQPSLKTEEEKRFYKALLKEVKETEKTKGEPVQWAIPVE